MHLNLVIHNPIVIHIFHNIHNILVIAFSSFWDVVFFLGFFLFSLVVHQPCNAETDTCLQPYNPFHFYRIALVFFGLPAGFSGTDSRAHPGANTFPPEADFFVESLSSGPSASRNTLSVSTITDGYARAGRPQLLPALT